LDLRPHREHAESAARAAGRLVQDLRGRFTVAEKGVADLVTTADPAAQRLIIEQTLARFPESTFLAEEEGVRPDPARPLRWIIDPIDGTTNYVHGFPFYAVSIGLEVAGRLVAGAIYDPSHDQMYSAAEGLGATCNGEPIRVSTVTSLSGALLGTGFPPALGEQATGEELALLFQKVSRRCHAIVRFGSATLSLAYLAAGRLDGVYAYNWKPWDCAAGVVIVREAGGTVANFGADGYDLYRGDIVAGNGRIDAELAQVARLPRG
jgi:myo-inositol-1(or 4)-monophosphatase